MHKLNIERVTAKLIERGCGDVHVSIHEYQVASAGDLAKVICSFSRKVTRDEAQKALASKFFGRALPIEDSFQEVRSCSTKTNPVVCGFLRPVKVVKKYSEEAASAMRTLANNIMLDENDKTLWQVKNTDSGDKFLIRQDNEDLSELLALARVRSTSVPKVGSLVTVPARSEYVAYVDPYSQSVRSGYVVSSTRETTTILPLGGVETFECLNDLLVNIAYLNGADKDAYEAIEGAPKYPETSATEQEILDYFRQVYTFPEAKAFLKELEDIIRSRSFS
jgi:hypothetical protein